MKGRDDQELLKAGLKRKLTAAEEARLESYFAEHPEEQAAWEEDASLNYALRRLPDAPLSSNFTAQVLRLVEKQVHAPSRSHAAGGWHWLASLGWARKLALTAALFAVAVVSYHQYLFSHREEVARGAATFSSFATLPTLEILENLVSQNDKEVRGGAMASRLATRPTLEILENFEAIKRLEQVPTRLDIELVAALQ